MFDSSITFLISIVVALILMSSFFSASEIGLMSLNRYRLRHLAKQKQPAALRVQQLLRRPDRLLSVILIGNTFANIAASALATMVAARVWGDMGVAIATIILTFVVLIFGEMAPKTLAAVHPMRVAFQVSWPLLILQKIFSPLVLIANLLANGVLRIGGVKIKLDKSEHLTREELRTLVNEAGSLIPNEHKAMLVSILDLSHVTVDDVMVPRNDIVGINISEPWDKVIDQLENSQHTRLPIYDGNIDKVFGIVHLRRVVNAIAEDRLNLDTLQAMADDVFFVPEGTSLSKQLLNFKQNRCRSALVVDEYGDLQGLVTIEDILEEIVGEFTNDVIANGRDIHPQEDGSVFVDGSALIRELNRTLDWELPADGPKTLSGLIVEHLGYIPTVGTGLKIAGYPMEVIQVKDNRIKTIKVLAQLVT